MYSDFPFPKELMSKMVQQNSGESLDKPASQSLEVDTCDAAYTCEHTVERDLARNPECSAALQATFLLSWRLCLKAHVFTHTVQYFR